ncbi:MAG: SDR family NAD(P)-dependent oxidoreductase [Burkholderiales bacterium]
MASRIDGKLALVTGGNRGIGMEACRQLALAGARVVLASRDAANGDQAAAIVRKDGHTVIPLTLDVTDTGSIAALGERIEREYGKLDILVNNAGISMDGVDVEVARRTLATNFFGVVAVTDALARRMASDGRIVMVSSAMGQLSAFAKPMRERLLDPALTRDALIVLMESFIADVRSRTHEKHGWPRSAYRASKAGLNAFTRILARDPAFATMRINAVSPGWARTDMGGRGAPRSVEVGAASVVWAALLPPEGSTGGFFQDGEPIEW